MVVITGNVEEQLELMGMKLADAWNSGEIERYNKLMDNLIYSDLTGKGVMYVINELVKRTDMEDQT